MTTETSLVLDFETRSPLDIKLVGLDNYMAKAEPLCVAWAIDDGPVKLFDFTRYGVNSILPPLILDSRITKVAHNIAFERAMLRKLGLDTPISEWIDTSVLSRYAGLPSKLADVCKALKLGELGKGDGSRLITKFCKPKKDGTFRDWTSHPEDWQKFLEYCKQDVVAEREVFKRLSPLFTLPPREKKLWELDDKINRRGWPTDTTYVRLASFAAFKEKEKLTQELKALTGLQNPNSRDQFLGWAKAQGYEFNSLGKAFIKRMEELFDEDTEGNEEPVR
jgi:DNA polymerase